MEIVLLGKFNNYFNRTIKKYETINDYEDNSEYTYFLQGVNFNPNDSILTELIVGYGSKTNPNPISGDYDYLVCYEEIGGATSINSRWFIVDAVRTREGQYRFKLKRDVIADNFNELLSSPAFIQKGKVSDDNPLIVNDEGVIFNQIKTSETLLKDRTNSAWVVGYVAKNAASTDINIQVNDEEFSYSTISDVAQESGINESVLVSLLNVDGVNENPAYFTKQVEFRYLVSGPASSGHKVTMKPDLSSGDISTFNAYDASLTLWDTNSTINTKTYFRSSLINNKASVISQFPAIFNRSYYLTEEQYNKLYSFKNKIIKYNGKYYEMSFNVKNSSLNNSTNYFNYTAYSSIATVVNEATTNIRSDLEEGKWIVLKDTGKVQIRTKSVEVFIQLDYISSESGVIPAVNTKISSSRNTVNNQAFDMFCIPYGPALFNSDTGEKYATSEYALSIGAQIAVELDAELYDLQLLPYCPLIENFDNFNKIDLTALQENVDFNYIDKTNATIKHIVEVTNLTIEEDALNPGQYEATGSVLIPNITSGQILTVGYEVEGQDAHNIYSGTITKITQGTGVRLVFTGGAYNDHDDDLRVIITYTTAGTDHISFILWCKKASFSTQIETGLILKDSMKVESQCNFYRLNSPNYQGSFEFNVAKNGGSVNYFIVECTYKPYTPYIKVAPQFSFLYGTNYSDTRGLICGGDFSLPRFNSAWESYQLNNKNYQNIFNRDIQNLDFNQNMQRISQYAGGGIGIARDTATGAGTGALLGGGWGALAGGIVGGIGSTIGYAVDNSLMEQQIKEAREYSIDKYNYQLGNIKALPYTITKVGSFDINSKVWPFLEYYTCTDEEKEALELKIQYEGMTVGRIDVLSNYITNEGDYLQAQLIRNTEIGEDTHMFNDIYNELLKGVYI